MAQAYAKYKQRINPLAPYDVPTLFINGYTHEHIQLTLGSDKATFFIDPVVEWAQEVETKYHGLHLGLNSDSLSKYRKVLFPIIRRNLNRQFRGR